MDSKPLWDFGYWLRVKYRGSDSPEGDFYADMIRDMRRERPPFHETYTPQIRWKNSYDWIKNHLEELGACYVAIETFERLWKKYARACPEGAKNADKTFDGL
ncbi:MAG: hypothetical protein IJ774_04365 [Selenomonadaceae bacterium]|nr:hypothetical protein [Selenomonadaceae bacterium]